MGQPRYSTEEIVRRGQAIYEEQVREKVEAEPKSFGRTLSIDIETGEYEIDDDYGATATLRLRERHPEGVFYVMRLGHSPTLKIGARGWHLMRRQ
jgi:hypothetical protein